MNESYAVVSGGKLGHRSRSEKDTVIAVPRSEPGTVFGLHLSSLTHTEVADLVLQSPRAVEQGVGVIATANIQHIAQMRHNAEFRTAMVQADLVTCDGFPVFRYANYQGINIQTRTTGRDIVATMMNDRVLDENQRLFFVVDSMETGEWLERWAKEKGVQDRITFEVPPSKFSTRDIYCEALAKRITAYGTTILMLCVGAPQSEVFAHRYRSLLPACWALCVGQSAKIVLGLAPTPPRLIEAMSIEWLWRMMLEPRRLVKRYLTSSIGFLAAVMQDMRVRGKVA
jgi:N-acetylglucosaminyldiphosphoundecaprenol N-acetyl-beta-D-mannosaminyltransferase